MKELGNARRILGMEIKRDIKNGTLFLSQKSYIQKVLQRFSIVDPRPVLTPIASHFKLSSISRHKLKMRESLCREFLTLVQLAVLCTQ